MVTCSSLDTARAAGIRLFDQGRMLTPGQWRFDWAFAPGDPAFEGHFPHQPILPAVFLLEMAQRAAEFALRQGFGQSHALRRVDQFRFSKPVLPGDACVLLIEWSCADGGQSLINVRASFSNDTKKMAHGSLTFAPQQAAAHSPAMSMEPTHAL